MEVRRHLTIADSLLLLRGTRRITQVPSAWAASAFPNYTIVQAIDLGMFFLNRTIPSNSSSKDLQDDGLDFTVKLKEVPGTILRVHTVAVCPHERVPFISLEQEAIPPTVHAEGESVLT